MIISLLVSRSAWQQFAFGLTFLTFLLVSDDVGVRHMLRVDTAEFNYRLVYGEQRASHYYLRSDHRSPAEYINTYRRPRDIVITSVLPIEYYLDRLDYVYRRYTHEEFPTVSCDSGRRERWTNVRMLYNEAALYELIGESKERVWLILNRKARKWFKDEEIIAQRYTDRLVYTTPDHAFDVYLIDQRVP